MLNLVPFSFVSIDEVVCILVSSVVIWHNENIVHGTTFTTSIRLHW